MYGSILTTFFLPQEYVIFIHDPFQIRCLATLFGARYSYAYVYDHTFIQYTRVTKLSYARHGLLLQLRKDHRISPSGGYIRQEYPAAVQILIS